jgi:uncharacterized membrane protein
MQAMLSDRAGPFRTIPSTGKQRITLCKLQTRHQIVMKINQSRLVPSTLLFLYLIARILQLFAGRVPNLATVILHVIPPALFALIQGARRYGKRGIVVFTGLCLGVATFFETLSLRTGFPFGHDRFTDLMGPKISGLPVLLALAWLGMGYLSWMVSLAIIGGEDEPLSGRRVVLVPLLASFAMTVWDLSMEAVWADIYHGWIWRDGGPYYGVPISNFFGWLLTAYVFYQLFAFYARSKETVPSGMSDWPLAILFYAVCAVGNLLVIAPTSLGGVFVDASGKDWMISNILWTSRVVSLFLMLPLSLLAWFKVSHPRD